VRLTRVSLNSSAHGRYIGAGARRFGAPSDDGKLASWERDALPSCFMEPAAGQGGPRCGTPTAHAQGLLSGCGSDMPQQCALRFAYRHIGLQLGALPAPARELLPCDAAVFR